jgi:hypothetical protein
VSVDNDGLGEKKIKLIDMGEFQGLNTSCSGQKLLSLVRHKVFNWTDMESMSSIWLTTTVNFEHSCNNEYVVCWM